MTSFGKRQDAAILGRYAIDRVTSETGYIDGYWSEGTYRLSFLDGHRAQRRREQFRLIPASHVSEDMRFAFD